MIPAALDSLGVAVLIAVLIGAVARSRGWNAPLLLLTGGLVVGLLPFGPDAPPDPEFVLTLILAPLVFGEALSSSAIDIRRVLRPVAAMAVFLVLLTAGAVGFVATLLLPSLPLASALCLGAVLGPTDPVAVASTAKSAGLPRRLMDTLDGESLLNDGTALALLRVCAGVAAAGSATASEVAILAVQSILGGVAVGVAGGWALTMLARRARDTTVANGALLVAPLPMFGAAEALGGSGILAVVAAALIFAHKTSSSVAYAGRLQAASVWRTLVFVLQSAAFFLVGVQVPLEFRTLDSAEISQLLVFVPAVMLVLISVRFLFVYCMFALQGRARSGRGEWVVMGWAGTRGPISVLAAFTLPLTLDDGSAFPDRSVMISATFCVVIASLLLALTVPAVARAARLPAEDETPLIRRVRVSLARASLNRLEEIAGGAERDDRPVPAPLLDQLRSRAELRLNESARVEDGSTAETSAEGASRNDIVTEMAHAEQEELLRLRDEEGLPDALMRVLQHEIDVRLRAQRAGMPPH